MPTARMPAVFVGHGSPMNAIEHNAFTQSWRALGAQLPRPRAIVSVSGHWYTRGTLVTAQAKPPAIYDFGGFARELHEVRYDAPGDPALAARLVTTLAPHTVRPSEDWGLDHGTWSVLVHMYPQADIPVVQLSVDETQPPAIHYALGRRLAALRDDRILVLGTGGIVHNLAHADLRNARPPSDWAIEFDERVKTQVLAGDDAPLVDYLKLSDSARLAVPTPEHYLPLLYVLGTREPNERASIPVSGFDLATISMTSVVLGGP